MITLTGYHITDILYRGTRTEVYRGTRTSDNQPVIIKVLRNPHPNFNELVQFRNQYVITRNLDSPYIVQLLTLERYGNGYALVMLNDGMIALSDYWQQSERTLSEFLSIAIQLSEALHYLSQQRIIHKDIKPANILIHAETKQVQLIDFSIASLLPKEQQQLTNPNVLQGTLAYISPEQTGRMNRGIDYRTDFYSLGVTFYELLTGQLPFTSDDPMELVHGHIAKKVQFSLNSEQLKIPEAVQKIVLKLSEKNAEDRYQSALGLKHDLERCLQEWESTGEIVNFELGARDVGDRFIIPEKLYGREKEVTELLAAFERVSQGEGERIFTSELLLVAGFSGIGKTAVVNEVHKPIVRQRGYFIKGKFDQFNRHIPFSAFVQAFRDLMRQLLGESDVKLNTWKEKILDAVGENGQVIIDVVPELEAIVGQQPPVPELSGSAAQNRFNLLLGKFVRVFTTKDHPLVIFLDDLQWADSASLNLLKLLMDESDARYLLVLGAYRDNEVFRSHPLMFTLDEIKKQGATINTLTLAPLGEVDISRLVADTLLCSVEIATPLSKLVYQKTQGNPFFSTQFLQGLYEDGCITVDLPESPRSSGESYGGWQCDLAKVRQLALTDNVVAFMVKRLQKLSEKTQEVMKLAACIGNQFDLETLALVSECSQEQVAVSLWKGLQEGFIVPQSETYKFFQEADRQEHRFGEVSIDYRFLHDRVQQAAYSLIPEDEQKRTHLSIGQLFLEHLSKSEQSDRLFDIVNHLNLGQELIQDFEQKLQLAQLNLSAGKKAREATAYQASFNYISTGLTFLPQQKWEQSYDLTLLLHQEGATIASLIGEFDTMNQWATAAMKRVKTLIDRIPFYETQIQALVAQKQLSAAIKLGIETLEQLGELFSENPKPEDFPLGIQAISSSLADRNIEDLINLPPMADLQGVAILRVLWRLSSVLVMAAPQLMPFCIFKAVQRSITSGNSVLSAPVYVTYGMILCGAVGDISTGYRFGKLALQVIDKYQGKEVQAKTLIRFNAGVRHWQESLKETLDSVANNYQLALEVGDLESAAISAEVYGYHAYFSGRELQQLSGEMEVYSQGIKSIQQQTILYWNEIYRQQVLNLLGQSDDPCSLVGTAYDENIHLPMQQQYNDAFGLGMAYLFKAIACYLFDRYDQAIENLNLTANYLQSFAPFASAPAFYFYTALAHLGSISNSAYSQEEELPAQINQYLEKIRHWANHAPMNYQHKAALIAAEKYRVFGNNYQAGDWYDRAIAGAKENGYIQEEALANELAARFYLNWGKEKIAIVYIEEAYYCYARWGAKAKTDQLEAKYSQLLTSILQQSETIANANTSQSFTQTIGSSTQMTSVLDLSSAIKASQTISEEIELDALLSKLMLIVVENAGADKGILILDNSGSWEVPAVCVNGSCNLSTIPLDQTDNLPRTIINTVKHTQKTVLINQLEKETTFTTDPYLIQQQPKSLFCQPILHQSKLIGILYLENKLTAEAFTPDRIEVLKLLTAQAAISIENACLYGRLEDYSHNLEAQVELRTQELQQKNQSLQQTLQKLQSTQAQLIQTEKMSSLGQMVAGIAHEINNPITFIAGNIIHTRESIKNLFDLIDLYQQDFPQSSAAIKDKVEEIELEYLCDDLTKMLDSMEHGSDRISKIILGLRNFSRLDEAQSKQVDIHEGLENSLMIIQHRFKGQGNHPEIAMIKNYGKLSPVHCYASQLNQVFLQILINAIYVLRTSDGNTYPEIRITTEMQDEQTVRISIADNGPGMSENVRQKVFDPFFTTKPVGQGTGLGLSTSYQIITEQHQGQLYCISQPGKGTEFVIEIPVLLD